MLFQTTALALLASASLVVALPGGGSGGDKETTCSAGKLRHSKAR